MSKSLVEYVDSPLRNYENVSPEEVVDYYKSLGDWQNLLTKTDYTYSPISVYHKKKINGVYPVIPNMSRPALWTYKFRKDTADVKDYILNNGARYSQLLRSASDDSKTTQKWTFSSKRSFAQPSTFMHFFLLSLFIFFVLFSLKSFSFHF